MRPPSLSAHLSPAGLAAQGPHVSEEVCLCVCMHASVWGDMCLGVTDSVQVRATASSHKGNDVADAAESRFYLFLILFFVLYFMKHGCSVLTTHV